MFRRERNRIHLAKLLKRGGNLLLLDEPTNDLDVGTMRVLEQAIIDFPGCVLTIIRPFSSTGSIHICSFSKGTGKYVGSRNFSDYEETVLAAFPDTQKNRRSKYRKIPA